jgi:Tfp pilus assembly protein PilO
MAKKLQDLPVAAQAALLIVAALALAGGVFYFQVWPLYKKINDLDKEVKALHADNVKNQVFEQEQTEYLNRIESLKKQIETQRSFVPDEPAQDQFVRMVHDAGLVTGINVRTFVAQGQVPHDYYVEMPFLTRLDGTYYALLSFFDRLAHAQRIVSVNSIALGGPGGGGMGAYVIHGGETVGANVVLVTYFNRPQPAAPPPPAKK